MEIPVINFHPVSLRAEIEQKARELERLRKELEHLEINCHHEWSTPEYTPERYEGFYFEGDPPGTMGVDRQLPGYFPPQTIDKWTRKCLKCGKTQTTTSVEEVKSVTRKPRF